VFRIGGDVRGLLARDEVASRFNRPVIGLPHELGFIPMTVQRMSEIDELSSQPVGALMVGFELLSAGVIQYAESMSQHGVVGYFERKWGLEIVDCAVAWHHQRIVAGPLGTSVTADASVSALTDVLSALGVEPDHHVEVLRAIADL
jgi:hypothetical protein